VVSALASPYQGYLYAYPHKSAYRGLRPRPLLREVWATEPTDALFLYVHVPFCEMRCGFCNLFTRALPPADQVRAYLAQLAVQANQVRAALGERASGSEPASFARAAIGGGTPTYLDASELHALLDVMERFGVELGAIPLSVETSPATATPDRLAVLVERGATRISIGVQSFVDTEARAVGRPQRRSEVERALAAIRAAGPAALNLDLIYGIPGQTVQTWAYSLSAALAHHPEEVYLYPLYVRPLTGLQRHLRDGVDPEWDAQRMALYLQGRDMLRAHGYQQVSMRMFRRVDARDVTEPSYCCQDDGMVGLGCGARSYTAGLHYSFDYAVGVGNVRTILEDYLGRPAGEFAYAETGFALDGLEQRRRWLLKSLLRCDGVSLPAYAARFGTQVTCDFSQLGELVDAGYATQEHDAVRLTDAGLAHSDAIGPWLTSDTVRAVMTRYVAR
jgi:oxygen-independent coproporphyrinogen-3 oxidase